MRATQAEETRNHASSPEIASGMSKSVALPNVHAAFAKRPSAGTLKIGMMMVMKTTAMSSTSVMPIITRP